MRKSTLSWALGMAAMAAGSSYAAEMGTAFTYQGYLEKPAGTPVTDTCDFRLGLWDADVGGDTNSASGERDFIGGGDFNQASGHACTTP